MSMWRTSAPTQPRSYPRLPCPRCQAVHTGRCGNPEPRTRQRPVTVMRVHRCNCPPPGDE